MNESEKQEIVHIEQSAALNAVWERRILDSGADFVCFVDLSSLPSGSTQGYPCAVLFGKALSREYISAIAEERPPRTKEVLNAERKMGALADSVCTQLISAGYESVARLKSGLLPHKTVALRAGMGFIGKNNLLVTDRYGCAQMLGKVLTKAPFAVAAQTPPAPKCGNCRICVDVCPTGALMGTTWSIQTARDDIITRKKCTLCVKCMAHCPYTLRYAQEAPQG